MSAYNKLNLKINETVWLDEKYNNRITVTIIGFTPNKMFATIEDENKYTWQVMTNRLTKINNKNRPTVYKQGDRKMNTKQYTTEEITRRLKEGESVTCIKNNEIDVTRGVSYETKYIDERSFKIIDDVDSNVWMMFAFNSTFMFTSDYEKMKREEKGMEAAYKTIQEEKKLPFVNLGSTTLIEKNDIPEWLQRERVRFWGNRFGEYKAAYMKNTDDSISMANEDLKEFDKRFLTQKETK